MIPRPLLATITWLLVTAPLSAQQIAAQQPNIATWQGDYAPVVVNGGYSDPYATVNAGAPLPWFGAIGALPIRETFANRLWFRADYLRWWTEGMDTPPLVTTSPSGTAQNQAAILGEPGTAVLFGGNQINDSSVNGFRTSTGFWSRGGVWGIEGEYFALANQNDGYFASGDGSTILGRPFFDITSGSESAQLISFPGDVSGSVQVASESQLKSFLINGRAALFPVVGAGYDIDGVQPDRFDWIVGYRYLKLDDRLAFGENRTTELDTTTISESFDSCNEFGGLQLGFAYRANFRRAWLESLLRIAVGNNKQTVNIQGNTSITESGVTDNYTGGLLAQRTNIGSYQRDQFTMIPEIGLTLGIRVTDRLHATIGYTMLYFPSVVRAGDQIDRDLNPNLFAPETVPFSGALRPRFPFAQSDYWADGISLGGEFQF